MMQPQNKMDHASSFESTGEVEIFHGGMPENIEEDNDVDLEHD